MITTDASSLGWGGVLEGIPGRNVQTVQGRWTCAQQEWHINYQELMAVLLTLQEFQSQLQNKQVLVRSDNTTTCAYINKGGGHEISEPVQSGHSPMGLVHGSPDRAEGGARPGSTEHTGRLSVQEGYRSERVEPTRPHSEQTVQLLGVSSGGPIRDMSQQQGPSILLSLPVPRGASPRRILNLVEGVWSGLRISTNSSPLKGTSEDQAGPRQGDSDSSTMAHESVVLDAATSPDRFPEESTSSAGPANTVSDTTSGSDQPAPDGVEAQRSTLRTEGFSEEVISTMLQARASSTLAGYNSKWNIFVRWCHSRKLDPHHSSVTNICSFLQEKLQGGLQWQTLKGYVAAISACHKAFSACSLGKDTRIAQFLKGSFRVKPPVKPIVPAWDLHVVLQAISGAPFEPMNVASLKYVTWKTAFLLAITSAARVSELQALDSSPDLCKVCKSHALLRLNPAFIPKCTIVEYLNREIELEALFPEPSTVEQRAMRKHCPVRALLFYLDRTKKDRKDSQLLLSYKPGQLGEKVSKSTIARWIQETIIMSYSLMGRALPRSEVHAQSTRAVAASLADVKGVSSADLCKAATWQDGSVFARHYRLNMAAAKSIATQVITAAVAGHRQ